ncbi:hypothetical protein [Pseudoalteromonas lipolytica]|uniref:Uncharacterized protein n=1 Tax=Pseudoalteromonas lipolytica TaxID=570156 RepID=A0A0P7E7E0_9GAMM|nr:hypothetical protein [Pseudoalteromonas lipolytica]KPM85551.1 hypothetical protein AOG27_01870 [Pseudoalteromonas lipolytica]
MKFQLVRQKRAPKRVQKVETDISLDFDLNLAFKRLDALTKSSKVKSRISRPINTRAEMIENGGMTIKS